MWPPCSLHLLVSWHHWCASTHHLVEIYSVYGCFEYTLLHEPKSASFRTESFRETSCKWMLLPPQNGERDHICWLGAHRDEYVLWFDISMEDAVSVHVVDGLEQLVHVELHSLFAQVRLAIYWQVETVVQVYSAHSDLRQWQYIQLLGIQMR